MFDFVIAGNQKCGTTSLYEYLNLSNKINVPEIKEIPYFTNNDFYGRKSKLNYYFGDYRYDTSKVNGFAYVNIGYYAEYSIERILELSPSCKFVFVMRDPSERVKSAFHYSVSRGWEGELDLTKAIDIDRKHYEYFEKSNLTYIEHSCYGRQMSKVLKYVEKENIYLIDFNDLVSDPKKVTMELLDWLGVSTYDFERDDFTPKNQAFDVKSKSLQRLIIRDNLVKKIYQYSVPNIVRGFLNKKLVRKLELMNRKNKLYVENDDLEIIYDYSKLIFSEDLEILRYNFPNFSPKWMEKYLY